MNNTWLKYSVGAISAIFLGAIGSGVWSGILSPLWSALIDGLIRLMASVFLAFKDNIYANAAMGFHEIHSLTLLTMTTGVIVGIYTSVLFLGWLFRFDKSGDKLVLQKIFRSKYIFFFVNMLCVTIISIFVVTIIQSTYSNTVTTKSLNTITIMAPYAGQQEHSMLLAQFYSIKNTKDYEEFYDKIKILSDKYKLKMELIKPL